MKFLASTIALILLINSTINAQFKRKNEINKLMDSISKSNPLPTFVVGGVNKKGVFYQYNHGNKIWSEKTPVSDNHIFRIASMTKAITSVAALQLVEQGKLQLDEPLDKLMPEMASIPILTKDGKLVKATKSITLRHLLTHTAGFGYPYFNDGLDKFKKNMPANYAYPDLPRVFEAGSSWQYGTNTDWVGKIVEKVSGKDLETYFRDNILQPLGMTRTFFNVPDDMISEISTFGKLNGDHFVADTVFQYKNLKLKTFSGGGGLFSTFKDYAKFIRCILNDGTLNNHQIIKKSTVDLMFTNNIGELLTTVNVSSPNYAYLLNPKTTFFGVNKYGLAWAIDQTGRKNVHNAGIVYWCGIGNTFYSIDRKKGEAVLFFSNSFPLGNSFTEELYYNAEGAIYNIR
jgi:CubicO group peptidase (beta-lactamase class C family)